MSAKRDEAGRELDAKIAERVMGWGWVGRCGYKWFAPLSTIGIMLSFPVEAPIREALDDDEAEGGWWLDANGGSGTVPYYSTDIASAWLIVEKLTGFVLGRDEPWWSVAIFNAQQGQVGCRVYACPPGSNIFDVGTAHALPGDDERIIAEVVGSTAPEAICLCALAALSERAS